MSAVTVPLDGQSTVIERKFVPLDQLYLDIDNPRIQYYLDARLNEDITQDQVRLALVETNEQYERLKQHIEINGGIYNPIWVTPDGTHYRVIEGNTRTLVYSELTEKYANEGKWRQIDCYILPKAVGRDKINFIRLEAHLFGQTPWDAYEKARELHRLHTEEDYSISRLEKLTKLAAYDIKNAIQAFMDMKAEYFPIYWKPGEQLKFSYFAEFRKNKDLKQLVREGRLSLLEFCDLVGKDKLGRGEDVRKLAMVWRDEEARNALLEEDMDAALDQLALKNPAAKSKLFEKIAEVTAGLEAIPFAEFDEIKRGYQPAKAKALVELKRAVSNLLSSMEIPD